MSLKIQFGIGHMTAEQIKKLKIIDIRKQWGLKSMTATTFTYVKLCLNFKSSGCMKWMYSELNIIYIRKIIFSDIWKPMILKHFEK